MPEIVAYDIKQQFSSTDEGIVVPVILKLSTGIEIKCDAKVDTGAEYCVLPACMLRISALTWNLAI
jgi:hypothetical protein